MKKVVAGALLTLPDGRWVVQRRTDDAPSEPGKLGFFGGSVERGETPEQGFLRELDEETSLDVKAYKLAGVINETEHYPVEVEAHLYHVRIPNADFDVFEGVRAEVYSPEELATRKDVSHITLTAVKEFGGKQWH